MYAEPNFTRVLTGCRLARFPEAGWDCLAEPATWSG